MLFNSYAFVLLFLPLTLVGFYLAGRCFGASGARYSLIVASLLFYLWWNPVYVLLLLSAVIVNFCFVQLMQRKIIRDIAILYMGIAFNLALLGYFKYADFFINNVNVLAVSQLPLLHIILPLGISFFLLQQIAFLVDVHEGLSREKSFADYLLFVVFFPQLIAGPIVHHREMMPQFHHTGLTKFDDHRFAYGLFVFSIGLFKKTVIADSLQGMVAVGFDGQGVLTATDAWISSTAYLFQAYFDFSGYSDMAVGLGLLFNIRLPLNFNSPYKAVSIIQFWQRWHMTLTDFINAYIYMPLMRLRGSFSFYYSLFVTVVVMIVVGLWHGAGWNYVLFGFLHGVALVINHLWRRFGFSFHKALGWALTILWWHVTLVVFRASTMDATFRMLHAMLAGTPAWIGKNMYEAFPLLVFLPVEILTFVMFLLFGALFACCVYLKNTHDHREIFTASTCYFIITFFCLISSVLLMNHVTEFIYFQF